MLSFLTKKYSEILRARLRALCHLSNNKKRLIWQTVCFQGCPVLVPSTLAEVQDRVRGLCLANGCIDFYSSPGLLLAGGATGLCRSRQSGVWFLELQEESSMGR